MSNKDTVNLEIIDRREFILGASAMAALAAFVPLAGSTPAFADEKVLNEAIKKAIGDAKPVASKNIKLDVPEIAENGNTVPFTVDAGEGGVRAVHVFATGNPRVEVASFHFSPMSGKAAATSRMRLGKTQDVLAIAQMNDGKVYMAKNTVKVTIGGCGG
jgi:sulfur-oxidizing protein SoxY